MNFQSNLKRTTRKQKNIHKMPNFKVQYKYKNEGESKIRTTSFIFNTSSQKAHCFANMILTDKTIKPYGSKVTKI